MSIFFCTYSSSSRNANECACVCVCGHTRQHSKRDSQLHPVLISSTRTGQITLVIIKRCVYVVRAAPQQYVIAHSECNLSAMEQNFRTTENEATANRTDEEKKKIYILPATCVFAFVCVCVSMRICEWVSLMACAHSNVNEKHNDTMPPFHIIVQLMMMWIEWIPETQWKCTSILILRL